MSALAGNTYSGKIEWMPDDLTVDRLSEQFSEGSGVYIGRREEGLAGVGAGSRVVIVPCGNRRLAQEGHSGKEQYEQQNRRQGDRAIS
jgi:hypothetical protein